MMESTDATNFQIAEGEEPAEADGIVTAWIRFETALGRGSGLLRLGDEGAWTRDVEGSPRAPRDVDFAQFGASSHKAGPVRGRLNLCEVSLGAPSRHQPRRDRSSTTRRDPSVA